MAIIGSTVKTGATALSTTGGSDMTFSLTGLSVTSGINVAIQSDTDYRTRRNASFKSRVPQVQNGVFSKGKNEVVYVRPLVLQSGLIVFNTIRLGVEVHPELTSSDAKDLRMVGAQLLTASAYEDFWSTGALV